MLQTELLETFNKLPESLQQEVLHFAEFLAEKHNKALSEVEPPKKKRQAGALKGKIWMADDFDEPLELVPTEEKPGKRGIFGVWKGKIKMADDFDEPLEEFKEYME